MPESIEAIWRNASPLKRGLLAGVPAAIIALAAVGVIYAAFSGGGSTQANQQVLAATQSPASPTKVPATPTAAATPTETPVPVSAGLQATNDGPPSASSGDSDYVPPADGDGGGGGGGAVLRNGGDYETGPGPIEGTDMTLAIPSIGVNATVYSRTVGTDGRMGDPSGPWQAIWYDFSQEWVGIGGYPGQPGANAVFAGHVDYIHVGPAVFWSIRDLQPGDIMTVYTGNGPIDYSVQWAQWADPEADFSQYVAQTGQESITLVTCTGEFSGGHYSNRFIVRGVRV